ncbi:hypothetical protein [Inquilinus limosus]|uniref:hypothetical protein n=1 Tax=Inquilinus limosus TaxID=171674 RepID=UPI001377EEA5|nr:hypothetical protein [Inquilinus limosus]
MVTVIVGLQALPAWKTIGRAGVRHAVPDRCPPRCGGTAPAIDPYAIPTGHGLPAG